MTKIDSLFASLRSSRKKALMPFVTAGDPDLQFTADVIRELDRRGCTMCEVGIPYSDPIADGPVIQASYTRALANKIKVKDILAMLAKVSGEVQMPLVTMISYAIIHRYGLERFVQEAKQAGVCGAIVPDLLVDEAEKFAAVCKAANFNLIQLVTPTTPRERAIKIAQSSSGFLYYVSIAGITGERTQLPADLIDNVKWLKSQTELPICIGFGISQPSSLVRPSSAALPKPPLGTAATCKKRSVST
jgi:tryptophan synthase alpha chain